jgi:hypothetical protein
VIYLTRGDGKLFSAHANEGNLVVQDNDHHTQWPGAWYCQYQHPMGPISLKKILSGIRLRAEARSAVSICTGATRIDETYTDARGTIMPIARVKPFIRIHGTGHEQEIKIPIPTTAPAVETSGYPPAIRLSGEPNEQGENRFVLSFLDIFYSYLSNHR